MEACNTVAGSSLENAAWFRRTLAVIPQPELTADQSSNVESEVSEISEAEPAVVPPTVASSNPISNTSSYSAQALCVLAEVLAPVLDMVFGSDEKERMTSFLTTVMYNVTPFLKNHRYVLQICFISDEFTFTFGHSSEFLSKEKSLRAKWSAAGIESGLHVINRADFTQSGKEMYERTKIGPIYENLGSVTDSFNQADLYGT